MLDASIGKPAAGVAVTLECLALDDTPPDGQTLLELPQALAQGYVTSLDELVSNV